MKKILVFVLTLSLLTTFFAVPAFAQGEQMSIENNQNISSNDDTIEYYIFFSNGNISETSFSGETEEVYVGNIISSKLEKDFEGFDKVVYYPFEKEAEVYYKDGRFEKIENFNVFKYIYRKFVKASNLKNKSITRPKDSSIIAIKSEGTVVIDYFDGRQSAFYAEEGNNCDRLIKSLEKQYEGFDYISISPKEIMIFYKDGSWEKVEKLSVNLK